jgi:tetratricopeptide (TPR) repeat protein
VYYAERIKEFGLELGYKVFRDLYKKENDHTLLENLYIDCIRDFPESVIYMIELATFYSNIGENQEKSFKYFEKILLEHPKVKIGLIMFGKTCAETGSNLDRGIECLTDYLKFKIQLYPDLAHYYLGEIYLKKGNKDRAINEYETALKINPENKKAKIALISIK